MRLVNGVSRLFLTMTFAGLVTAIALIGSSQNAGVPTASAMPAAAPGDTYCVAVISTTYPGCTRVFTDVQAAVDAASGLETIKVAQGTYATLNARPAPAGYFGLGGSITQVLYITKTVFIQGGYTTTNWTTPDPAAYPVTLDAQAQGRVVFIAGDITPTLTGLRLINGNATDLGGFDNSVFPPPDAYDVGGGVFILSATATLSNSWVTSSTANTNPALPFSAGGGVYLDNSPAILYGNTVATNTAQYGGGLCLFNSDATVSHNVIHGNSINNGGYGGGLYAENSVVVIDHNTILTNSAASGNGGGVGLSGGASALVGNLIAGNTALDPFAGGGGLYLLFTNATLSNNVIADNQVGGLGAGVYVASSSTLDFLHNTLAQNTGGDGSGIYLESSFNTVYLADTILVSHTIGLFADATSAANLDSTLFGGGTNTAGTGAISSLNALAGNPGFVNPAAHNYHLTTSSAAIDQGFDAGVTTDIDDETRPIGLGFDLGADELYHPALTATKSASSDSALPGAVITYTIRLTNTGNVTLTSYISDTLPPSVTFKGPITVNPAGGSIGTPPSIAGGQSIGLGGAITVTVPVTLKTGTGMAAGSVIANSAAITTSPTTVSAQPIVAANTVTILNAAPVAANDAYTTPANSAITMNVRDNDTDSNGDALTVTAVGSPLNGTASINGGASVIYTPTTSFVGTDLFTYTVRDPGGLPGTASITIDVINVPISGLAAQNGSPTTFGAPTLFTATIAAGTNVNYLWNFGDGSTSVGQTASHTYLAVGSYTAIVTATNPVPSSASASTVVTITKATPAVAITADTPDPSVVGQSVGLTFTVTPPGAGTPTGVVTVTDGTQSCTATLPTTACTIAFTSAGAKSLTAQYSGDANFNAATSGSAAHTVSKADTTTSVSSIVPSPALFGQSTTITASVTVNAPGAGTPTGVITLTDGTVTCTATLPSTSCNLIFNTLGARTISATYSGDANFSGSSGTAPLTVNDVPVSGLTAQNSSPTRLDDATFFTATITAGTNVSYVWDFGDGSPTANGANVAHTYAISGTYTAIVTASNSFNSQSVSRAVTITNQRPVAVALDNAYSPGTLATLDGSGSFDPDLHTPLTYFWLQTGGAPVAFTPNLSVTTFTAPGAATVLTFTLTVTDARNLPSLPKQVVITIADLPITSLSAINSSPTVVGTPTYFTATQVGGTGVSYAWNFGDGVGTGSGSNPNYTYSAVGAYTATVTATNAVNQLVTTTHVIVGEPIGRLAAANSSPTFAGSSTAFTATIMAGTAVNYQWDFGDGGTASGASATHTYGTPGSYTAIVTATNLFGSQAATTTVTILAQAGLSLVKLAAPDPASVGRPLVYTLIVHNGGPTAADNVVVTDTLAAGLTFGTATTTQGACAAPTVTCSLGTLINGGTVTVTIMVTPSMSITSPVIITNRAGVSSTTADPTLADNVATITTTIYPRRLFLPVIRR